MTGTRDRFGELIEENEEILAVSTTRTRDEIHRDRCAQLRAILAEARQRREDQTGPGAHRSQEPGAQP